jgi:hypothetical protein
LPAAAGLEALGQVDRALEGIDNLGMSRVVLEMYTAQVTHSMSPVFDEPPHPLFGQSTHARAGARRYWGIRDLHTSEGIRSGKATVALELEDEPIDIGWIGAELHHQPELVHGEGGEAKTLGQRIRALEDLCLKSSDGKGVFAYDQVILLGSKRGQVAACQETAGASMVCLVH